MELVGLGEGALPHESRDHRERARLGELEELLAGVAVQRAATDIEHWLARDGDRPRGLADL